jgi:hypothetical protein
VRIRFVLALMVAGMLSTAGVAAAQSTTDTLGDYTTTTPTVTTPKSTSGSGTTTPSTTPAAAGEEAQSNDVAPAVAAQPAGSAPSQLAFTGAGPLLLIALGIVLAGGTAVLLVRERRRSPQDR